MSNFICSECGMTNIDCGRDGYKTPLEIKLEKKLDIAVKVLEFYSDFSTMGAEAREALEQIKEVK